MKLGRILEPCEDLQIGRLKGSNEQNPYVSTSGQQISVQRGDPFLGSDDFSPETIVGCYYEFHTRMLCFRITNALP